MKHMHVMLLVIVLRFILTNALAQIHVPTISPGEAFDAVVIEAIISECDNAAVNSVTVSGTNISVHMTYYKYEGPNHCSLNVVYTPFAATIPALPEGNYRITSIEANSPYPEEIHIQTRDFSVPHPGDFGWGDDLITAFNGVNPSYTITSNVFEYVHLQRNDDPEMAYRLEICTNLTEGIWASLDTGTETNVVGGVFDEIIHSIPTTNSQAHVRLKVNK